MTQPMSRKVLESDYGWDNIKDKRLSYLSFNFKSCGERIVVLNQETQQYTIDGKPLDEVRQELEAYAKPRGVVITFCYWLASWGNGIRNRYKLLVLHDLRTVASLTAAQSQGGEAEIQEYQKYLKSHQEHPFYYVSFKGWIEARLDAWFSYLSNLSFREHLGEEKKDDGIEKSGALIISAVQSEAPSVPLDSSQQWEEDVRELTAINNQISVIKARAQSVQGEAIVSSSQSILKKYHSYWLTVCRRYHPDSKHRSIYTDKGKFDYVWGQITAQRKELLTLIEEHKDLKGDDIVLDSLFEKKLKASEEAFKEELREACREVGEDIQKLGHKINLAGENCTKLVQGFAALAQQADQLAQSQAELEQGIATQAEQSQAELEQRLATQAQQAADQLAQSQAELEQRLATQAQQAADQVAQSQADMEQRLATQMANMFRAFTQHPNALLMNNAPPQQLLQLEDHTLEDDGGARNSPRLFDHSQNRALVPSERPSSTQGALEESKESKRCIIC